MSSFELALDAEHLIITTPRLGSKQEIRSILNRWVTFVKTGDPTPDFLGEDSDYSPWEEVWEHYYPFNPFYLLIDRDWQAVEKLPNTPGIEFWESLSLDENVFKRKLVPVRDEL